MKSYKALVIILCIFMVMFFLGMLVQKFQSAEEIIVVRMQYQITDKMGFNTDTDALYFGNGYPGTTTKRYIILNNSHEYPVLISIRLEGDLTPFVSVSENNFVLQPADMHVITYYVKSPKETSYGNYTGLSTLIFKRVASK
ncbi:MAG: hypothetical protein ABIJ34_03600 [archaeon]